MNVAALQIKSRPRAAGPGTKAQDVMGDPYPGAESNPETNK